MTVALGYVRVSTADQAGEDKASLPQQRAAIDALAAKLGIPVVEVFADEGVSGGSADRPGFQALVRYCETHPRDQVNQGVVLALNDSRWGRWEDPEAATGWRWHLGRYGWRVRFCEGDDTEDPLGRGVMRLVHAGAAGTYRLQVKANARRGSKAAAEAGWWTTEAPIGYRRVEVEPSGALGRTLEPGMRKVPGTRARLALGPAEEVAFVHELYRRYAKDGCSLTELTLWARVAFPGRKWSAPTVRAVLCNPAYTGTIAWGRRPASGVSGKQRPTQTAALVVPDAHPALIDQTTWDAAQLRLAYNRRRGRSLHSTYILTGLLTCHHCGKPWRGGGYGKRTRAGEREHYYLHYARYAGDAGYTEVAGCEGFRGTVPQEVAEAGVLAAVLDYLESADLRAGIRAAIDALGDPEAQAEAQEYHRAVRRDIVTRRDRLVRAVAEGTFTPVEAREQLAVIRQELEAHDRARAAFRPPQANAGALLALEREALDFRGHADRLRREGRTRELADLLAPWIHSACVNSPRRELLLDLGPPLPGSIPLRPPGRG